MMELSAWSLALVLCKWLMYIGQAAAVGGVFCTLWIGWNAAPDQPPPGRRDNIVAAGCLLGLFASALGFFLHVGAFADNGLRGMFDAGMIDLLWETPVGSSTVYRIAGISILLSTLLAAAPGRDASAKSAGYRLGFGAGYLIGAGITCMSFNLVGHTAEAGLLARLSISLHGLAALWWTGSLYPLWLACRSRRIDALRTVMQRFGRAAIAIVLLLIGAGVVLILQLVGSAQAMVTTPYGLSLGIKLMLVATILMFAARHKWKLVPQLENAASARILSRSIALEGAVAAAILLVTAMLSTALGPDPLH